MYTKGHLGVALLVYAPVGLAVAVAGHPGAALAGGGVMLALAMVPDCDHWLPVAHRGPTHSLAFALAVGAVLGVATAALAGPPPVDAFDAAAFAAGVGTLAVLAHLLADLLTPMGVAPFWPVSARRYSLAVTPAKDPRANNLLLGVGVAVAVGARYLLAAVG